MVEEMTQIRKAQINKQIKMIDTVILGLEPKSCDISVLKNFVIMLEETLVEIQRLESELKQKKYIIFHINSLTQNLGSIIVPKGGN